MAKIIHEETGVGAVAITDNEKVRAFIGCGSDHHIPDSPIASQITKTAVIENRVIFIDGTNEYYTCPLSDKCPLNSVLVVPLQIDNEIIGTIKLYETKKSVFSISTRHSVKGSQVSCQTSCYYTDMNSRSISWSRLN